MRPNNRVAAVILAATLALFISPVHGLVFSKETASATLKFDRFATALAEDQRTEVFKILDRVRTWCELEIVVVVGYAGRGEATAGEQKRLTEARTAYVAGLLKLSGVPVHLTFTEVKLLEPWPFGVVELEFVGLPPREECPIPPNADGFRLSNSPLRRP